MIDGRLNFDTKINTSGFSTGLKTLGGQMKSLQNTALKLAGVLAGAFSVRQIIEYAAEVKALNAQFGQTFGDLQEQAQAAINKVAESSQILDTRLRATASSIYAFAKANGMDSQTALTMMGDALEVTADSAAYYDRSLEETGETLKSFLKGNYANDAALGISCTETTRNIAANKLYGRSFKDLSEAQKLGQAVKPIVDDLGEWFEDINSDILIPLSTWTVETLIPTVLDSLAAALEGLHAAWKTAYPIIKEKLWDGFLQPLAKWAGKTAVGLIKDLGDGLKDLGESMTENDVRVLIDLAETIGAIGLAIKGAGLVKGFATALGKLAPAVSGIGETLGAEVGAAGIGIGGTIAAAIVAAIAGLGIGTMIRDAIGGDKIDEALFPIFEKQNTFG